MQAHVRAAAYALRTEEPEGVVCPFHWLMWFSFPIPNVSFVQSILRDNE